MTYWVKVLSFQSKLQSPILDPEVIVKMVRIMLVLLMLNKGKSQQVVRNDHLCLVCNAITLRKVSLKRILILYMIKTRLVMIVATFNHLILKMINDLVTSHLTLIL